MMSSRTLAFSVFCEDARPEVNGKLSLMGVLRRVLGLSQSPQIMPKFVAVAFVDMPHPPPAKAMEVWLTNNGQPFFPRAHIPLSSEPGGTLAAFGDSCTITVPIEIVPFEATAGMVLQMHVRVGDYAYDGDTLTVVQASPSGSAMVQQESSSVQ
jgi:hypothetical protein